MRGTQGELLREIYDTWSVEMLDHYITELEDRVKNLNECLVYVRALRKKKKARKVLDTGDRSG